MSTRPEAALCALFKLYVIEQSARPVGAHAKLAGGNNRVSAFLPPQPRKPAATKGLVLAAGRQPNTKYEGARGATGLMRRGCEPTNTV
jgi:hypothetical protein